MPVSSLHPSYAFRHGQWLKCRDAFEGEDAIKAGGQRYLPKLKGQTDDDYAAYKRRALFYSITAKSVSALVGMASSKAPKLEYPEAMKPYFEYSRLIQFQEVYTVVLTEVLLQSRCGILVDMPVNGGFPVPIIYQCEDIINWREDEVGNLTLVVLREYYDDYEDDYTTVRRIRYRELRIHPITGEYVQTIHNIETDDEPFIVQPLIHGKPLMEIPFVAIHPFGIGFDDVKPLMLDIANVNISHYMSSADLEHGRHFTGLPTPVVIGSSSDTDLYIGSTKFLILPEKGSDAKYLEFTGQGLQSLEKAMSEKHSLLASLSARLLDNSSRGSEAADAVKLRYMSETASLSTVVQAIDIALNTVYDVISVILRSDPALVKITLDTDFMEVQLSAAEMTALFNGFFQGAVSKETLVYNMRKGRRLDPLRTDSNEISSISPILPTQPTSTVDPKQSDVKPNNQQ